MASSEPHRSREPRPVVFQGLVVVDGRGTIILHIQVILHILHINLHIMLYYFAYFAYSAYCNMQNMQNMDLEVLFCILFCILLHIYAIQYAKYAK